MCKHTWPIKRILILIIQNVDIQQEETLFNFMPNVTIKVCCSVSPQDNVIDQSESAVPLNNVQCVSINAICDRSQTLTLDFHL